MVLLKTGYGVSIIKNENIGWTHICFVWLVCVFLIGELIWCLLIYRNTKKTIYGKCPNCRTKGQLDVISSNPGKEKFKCNSCYHKFGMSDL